MLPEPARWKRALRVSHKDNTPSADVWRGGIVMKNRQRTSPRSDVHSLTAAGKRDGNFMADKTEEPPRPVKRHRGWRVLGWIVLVFVVLLVVSYFVVTSSAFVKGVVLPRIGKAMGSDITV